MTIADDEIKQIRTRFEKLSWALDERMRRLFAAAEASAWDVAALQKLHKPPEYHDVQFMPGWKSWLPKKCPLKVRGSVFEKQEPAENLSSRPSLG